MGGVVPGEAVGWEEGKLLCSLSLCLSSCTSPRQSSTEDIPPLAVLFLLVFLLSLFNMVGLHNSNLFCFVFMI